MAFLDAKLGPAARIRGLNLMFLKEWLDALPEGVEVLNRGVRDRTLIDNLNDTMSAVISIRFITTTISIKLIHTKYKVEFPTDYPGISEYLDRSNQSQLYLKGLRGTNHEIRENRSVSPAVYLFETIDQASVLNVLDTLKEAITIAMQAHASSLAPYRVQPKSTPDRLQAPVVFSETLKALKILTPSDLYPFYIDGLQKLDMDLLNTCKVSAQADGASYKVTIFTFNPFNYPPPRPLDNMLVEEAGNTYFCIDFNSTTHRYLTEVAWYDNMHPGFEITIRTHADMYDLWWALTTILNRFRTDHIERYTPNFNDPTNQARFAGPIGPRGGR
jgi:hypothetical protein